MIALVYVHNYNLNERIITPSTVVHESITFTTFAEYLFSNGLLRFRLPLLMAISGYLIANSRFQTVPKIFLQKFRTLLVPYFLISAIGFLIALFIELLFFKNNSGIANIIFNKPITHFSIKEMLYCILVYPLPFQLWYLKVLFMLSLLYPLIKKILLHYPVPFLIFIFSVWFFTNYPDGNSKDRAYVFFVLGVYLKMYKIDFSKPFKRFPVALAFLLFLVLNVFKTWLAFKGGLFLNSTEVAYAIELLYKTCEILGFYAMWFLSDKLVALCYKNSFLNRSIQSAFFIYAFHAPLMMMGSQLLLQRLMSVPYIRLIEYVVFPLIVAFICTEFDGVLRMYFPLAHSIITGGRNAAKENEASWKHSLPDKWSKEHSLNWAG